MEPNANSAPRNMRFACPAIRSVQIELGAAKSAAVLTMAIIEVRNFAHRDSILNTGPCAAKREVVLQEEKETRTGQPQLNWEQQDS